MRNAFDKDILRSIAHSLGRFIAVFAIVALGVGFYAGLRMTAPDMRLAADAFFDQTSLMDIRVVSTMGLADEDIEELRAIEGVEAVMPAYETDVIAEVGDEPYAMRVHSLPYDADAGIDQAEAQDAVASGEALNEVVLAEGRWPTANDECILSIDRIMNEPLSVGERLTMTECSTGLEDTLVATEYTVVGLAHSSYYASSTSMGSTTLGSGLVQQFVYVPRSDFAADYPITEAFVAVEGAKELDSSSAAYDELVAGVMERIEAIAGAREEARSAALKADAQASLDEARAAFGSKRTEALEQLDDAERKLDDAAAEIEASKARIADGQRQYDSGVASLATERAQANARIQEAEAELGRSRQALDAAKEELDAKGAELEAAWAAAQLTPQGAPAALAALRQQLEALPADAPEEQRAQLQARIASLTALMEGQSAYDAGRSRYETGMAQLAAGESELAAQKASAEAQFAQAERSLSQARVELSSGRAQLAAGEAEHADGRAEYESERARAEEELTRAEADLDEAQQDIDGIGMPEWLVMDRSKNYGAESFDMDAGRVDSIAMVFPFVFFLVAALVALTTMTRMVDEERMLIGTCKALGYSRARISSKYLVYAGSASLLGSVVGIAALSFSLPAIIMSAYSIVYIVPVSNLALDWPIALSATGLGVGITLAATLAAALSTLRESPAALMQPKAPKAGKRILLERIAPIWHHLSFLWKVTCRNIFRYKKRLFMTVIGIAGCTALLLTGFGLQDSINDIIDKHYGELIDYNMVVSIEEDADAQEQARVADAIAADPDAGSVARAFVEPMMATGDAGELAVEMVVPEDPDAFASIWLFRERLSHAPVRLQDTGCVVTEKLATRYGLSIGDEVALARQDDMGNATNEVYRIPITGVIESYIGHNVFLDTASYQRVFGSEPSANALYVRVEGDEEERSDLAAELREMPAVRTVAFNDETIDMYKTALESVNMVVIVLIVAAALLAFIVLYNLTNINITERTREIATLEVLGFTSKEIDSYIFREIAILSVLGALAGLVLGVFLENFVVTTAEVDAVMFGRDIHWPSFLYAFALTMAFTLIVTLAMRSKLKRIDMVSSLKSNE